MNQDLKRGFWIEHAPGASLDYGFNWRALGWLLPSENIATSTWSAPGGVVLSRQQLDGVLGVTSTFATGCANGFEYKLTNTITTNDGRTDSRTITLVCKRR